VELNQVLSPEGLLYGAAHPKEGQLVAGPPTYEGVTMPPEEMGLALLLGAKSVVDEEGHTWIQLKMLFTVNEYTAFILSSYRSPEAPLRALVISPVTPRVTIIVENPIVYRSPIYRDRLEIVKCW